MTFWKHSEMHSVKTLGYVKLLTWSHFWREINKKIKVHLTILSSFRYNHVVHLVIDQNEYIKLNILVFTIKICAVSWTHNFIENFT